MDIYEVDRADFAQGGGWCSAAYGATAPMPSICGEQLDTHWDAARRSLLEELETWQLLKRDDPDDLAAVNETITAIEALNPGDAYETTVAFGRGDTHFWLLRTSDAPARGADQELVVTGRNPWMGRPSPDGAMPSAGSRRQAREVAALTRRCRLAPPEHRRHSPGGRTPPPRRLRPQWQPSRERAELQPSP